MLVRKLKTPQEFINLSKEQVPLEMQANAPFIGTLTTERSIGMACLLEDGTVLTCLHVIFDFEKRCYDSIKDMKLHFINGINVYEYDVTAILHDGLAVLNQFGSSSTNYDYARLKLNEDPRLELGRGLQLDSVDHWGCSYDSEPVKTVSISGPCFDAGYQTAIRYISVSEHARMAGVYNFPQVAHHITAPGFSGQAVLPLVGPGYFVPNNILYALHSRHDSRNNEQVGLKVSAYLTKLKLMSAVIPYDPYFNGNFFTHSLTTTGYEDLRRNGRDRQEITTFFNALTAYLGKRVKESQVMDAIPSFVKPNVTYIDDHQSEHLGHNPKKSAFYLALRNPAIINALANCINKLVSHCYQLAKEDDRKSSKRFALDKATATQFGRETNFIVDLGFEIGFDQETRGGATAVQLQGFTAASKEKNCSDLQYHIFPKDISKTTPKNAMIINAQAILNNAPKENYYYGNKSQYLGL